jgi:hypothetical protein
MTMKFVVLLKMIPVGAAGGAPFVGAGIFTTSACGLPLLSYSVERPL